VLAFIIYHLITLPWLTTALLSAAHSFISWINLRLIISTKSLQWWFI